MADPDDTLREILSELKTLASINDNILDMTKQNIERSAGEEKRREEWEKDFGEKNISKNNQYLSRAIKSELNGLGKDIGNEIANSLPPALKELTSSITNSISKSFSTYNKIMDAADKDRQKQLEKLKKDFIKNGNANMPQSILDIFGGGSSGGPTGTTGSGGGGGGTPTSKVKMGDFDPEDAAGASKLGKLLPGIPGLGGLIGGAAKFAGPIALAGAALQIGGAVNKFQKQMAESGAITGEGRGAGLGAKFAAVKQGINPFDLVSSEFADKTITAFRSEGFKGSLAYGLSDSFLGITKQIGETLSAELLPTVTSYADAVSMQGKTTDQVKESVSGFTNIIKELNSTAIHAGVSADVLNANFSALSDTLIQTGTAGVGSADILKNEIESLFKMKEFGGTGLKGAGGGASSLAVSSSITQAAPFLAGMSGIASPLAMVGKNNVAEVVANFNLVFGNLAKAAPAAVFTSIEGVQQYAAYLNAAYLPSIGMTGFTVDQVVALLTDPTFGRPITPTGAQNGSLNGSGKAQSKLGPLKAGLIDSWDTFNNGGNVTKVNKAIVNSYESGDNYQTVMNYDHLVKSIESDSDLKATGITGEDVKDFLKKSGGTYTDASLKGFLQVRAIKNKLLSNPLTFSGKVKNQTIKALDLLETYSESGKSTGGNDDVIQNYLKSEQGKADQGGFSTTSNTGGASEGAYAVVHIIGSDLSNLIKDVTVEMNNAGIITGKPR